MNVVSELSDRGGVPLFVRLVDELGSGDTRPVGTLVLNHNRRGRGVIGTVRRSNLRSDVRLRS